MAVFVREACEADLEWLARSSEELHAMHAAAMPWRFRPPAPADYTADRMRGILERRRARVFIGVLSGEAAGYAQVWITREMENEVQRGGANLFINEFFVRPAFRRNSVGAALIKAVRGFAREYEISSVELNVMAFNTVARAFFHACGFAPLRETMVLDSGAPSDAPER